MRINIIHDNIISYFTIVQNGAAGWWFYVNQQAQKI